MKTTSTSLHVNIWHRLHQDHLEWRDLHDEGRAEIHAVRLSLFTAVRRFDINGAMSDRHEESGAVDHYAFSKGEIVRHRCEEH